MSMSWLRKVAHGPRPFFAYIAPKACHEPFTPAAWFVDFYVHLWVWAPVCSKSVVGQFLKPPKLLLFLVVVTMRQLVSSMHIFLKHSIAIGVFNACISQAFDCNWCLQCMYFSSIRLEFSDSPRLCLPVPRCQVCGLLGSILACHRTPSSVVECLVRGPC